MHNKKFTVVIEYEDNMEVVKKAQKDKKYVCVGSRQAKEGIVMNNVTCYKNKELDFHGAVMLAGVLKAASHDILAEILKREMNVDTVEGAEKFFANLKDNIHETITAKIAFEEIYETAMNGKILTFIVDRESVDGSER